MLLGRAAEPECRERGTERLINNKEVGGGEGRKGQINHNFNKEKSTEKHIYCFTVCQKSTAFFWNAPAFQACQKQYVSL